MAVAMARCGLPTAGSANARSVAQTSSASNGAPDAKRTSSRSVMAEALLVPVFFVSVGVDVELGGLVCRTCGTAPVLVTARQIAMYLCRELTDLSLPKIGQAFGGRDHTTVMHAKQKIHQNLATARTLYNQVTELTSRIKAAARS